ncbi:MAG TPA: Bcr/CflA family multidrug efflux MFS transporter [Bryobacteraceae bacterium]|nr:Bcr/CflA family multidrug efflux MFS transporter [Bryobacteraceae bacterium]
MPLPAPASPTGLRRLEILILLGILTAFAPLSIDMYLPAMPDLARYFAVSEGDVQFTMATFFLGFALTQSIYGPIVDRFGRKPPLYFGLLLYAGSSAACALAPSIRALDGFRLIQATGACAGPVIARAMVRDLFPPQQTRRVYSLLILVMGTAPIVAPLAGGYLLIWAGWKAIFWTLALAGALCCAAAFFRLPETLPPGPSIALREVGRTYKSLLQDRLVLSVAFASAFSAAGMFAYIAGSPFVFITLYGVKPEHFGWLFGLNALGLVACAQVNGFGLQSHRPESLMRYAASVQCIAGLMLVGAAALQSPLSGIAAPLFFYLSAVGFISPNALTLALADHGGVAGMTSALLGTIRFSMGAIVTMALGAIPGSSAMPMAWIIGVCGSLGLLTLLLLGRPSRRMVHVHG